MHCFYISKLGLLVKNFKDSTRTELNVSHAIKILAISSFVLKWSVLGRMSLGDLYYK